MSEVVVYGDINIINGNKEKGILSSQIKVKDILDIYSIDKSVNRDISYNRLPKLIKYLDNINSDMGIFFPAFVFSFRGNPINYYKNNFELNIPVDKKLIVIDGQHRIKALEKYIEQMDDEDLINQIWSQSVTVQIYFGLSDVDERNLFADINSNAKKVSMSLITKFDSRDVLNVLVTQLYQVCNSLQAANIEFNKSRLARPTNEYFSTSIRLKEMISIILFGKKSLNVKEQKKLYARYDEVIVFLDKLFTELFKVLPQTPGNVLENVTGHYGVQQAIAHFIHNEVIIDKINIEWTNNWEDEVEQLALINWNVSDSIWRDHLQVARKNTSNEYQVIDEHKVNNIIDTINKEVFGN